MKNAILLLTFLCSFVAFSQNYSRVKIFVDETELEDLNQLAIDLDHCHYNKAGFIQAELNPRDIQKLDQNGFNYQVVIQDVESFYANRLSQPQLKTGAFPCESNASVNYETPNNFSLGNMGGYLTYSEFLANLDSMASKYPNLITVKAPISTFQTHEGRPIYYVQISDNPGVDESEPQVLYTAIHHAREPASLSQTIFYMWYLLENYSTNDEVAHLVNNTDMFFVPVINPDGYIYNETTHPSGGGMWRKNRRDNGGGSFGVDLNRNYSYQWGTTGTSTTDTDDETYCGTAPFSEPETQAIKWLCENNNFIFASNAHTYGNLLLYPFGYASNMPTADHPYYQGISAHMVEHNHYTNQLSAELYPASGDSDDWMYDGDLGTKPKIFAFTPEIGSDADGFWPSSSKIDQICRENVFPNLRLAHFPHVYGVIQDMEPELWDQSTGHIRFELTRFGLTAGDFTVSITPINGFDAVGGPKTISGMQLLDVEEDSIIYTLSNTLNPGDEIIYVINLDNGSYVHHDTITKTYGGLTVNFNDPGNDLVSWVTNDWSTTTEDFKTPSSSITDSPNQNYSSNTDASIESANSFDLTNATSAFVSFWAKWEIEADWDYAQFEVSTDNGSTWIPMCGNYTNLGTDNQELDEPLYDGNQNDWVEEFISLNDFLGETIKFRFNLVTDLFVNNDGFYFDDFQVMIENGVASINEWEHSFSIYPNPVNSALTINPHSAENYGYQIYDLQGKQLLNQDINLTGQTKIDFSNLSQGVYILKIVNADRAIVKTKKIVKD